MHVTFLANCSFLISGFDCMLLHIVFKPSLYTSRYDVIQCFTAMFLSINDPSSSSYTVVILQCWIRSVIYLNTLEKIPQCLYHN